MADDRLIFRSRIDMWILIVLLGAAAACLAVILQLWPLMTGPLWWAGILLALGTLFPLWILVTTRYAMTDTELFVRCGPFSWTVPIADITNIERSDSAASSPALSLDRVRIDYGGDRTILVSPDPRKTFMQSLEYRRKALAGSSAAGSATA